jgi:AcrR family transcriptional regulator
METMLSFSPTMSPVRPAADSPYGQAYAAGRRAVRRLVLDAASRLLEAEGPDALTMRRIAGEVGCSTSVLYTMFGGKAGVAEGLWREGFERLRGAMERVTDDDPLGRLAALGRVYRENALANRAYYAIMFQRPIPGFRPSPEAYAESLQPLRILVDAAADCIRAGVFRDADPARVAGVLWAAAHGAVSLELAGYEGAVDAEARFQELMAAAATWFMARR